ncbi:YbhN family protein [Pseudomonas citronellolis]|uniref:lysylphosphatidylglycerol synthase transmembrane domain-containing protein n=1 Tax=Pseudomonas citronellolis TaxID=53408 RepID=UPI003899846E
MKIGKLAKKSLPIITAAIFVGLCYYHKDAFFGLTSFSLTSLITIIALHLLFHLINALILKQLSNKTNTAGSLLFFISVNQISSAWNYISPLRLAQFSSRAILLKKYLQISIKQSVSQFTIASITNVICNIAVAILAIAIAPTEIPKSLSLTVAGTAALGAMALFLFLPRLSRSNAPWLEEITIPFKSLTKKDFLYLIGLNGAQIALATAITYQLLTGADMAFSLIDCLLISTASVLLSIASLTPGNLGYREVSLTALGAWLGLEQGPLLAVLILDRAIQLGLTLSAATIFSLSLQQIAPRSKP